MNIRRYRARNNLHRIRVALAHPWPIYKRLGGIAVVVNRADGSVDDLGTVADAWGKRWEASSGMPEEPTG
jgi:hypothetical protein